MTGTMYETNGGSERPQMWSVSGKDVRERRETMPQRFMKLSLW